MNKKKRWRRIRKKNAPALNAFLKEEERFCVAACSRILHNGPSYNEVWGLFGGEDNIEALLLCFHQSFFPVFRGNQEIPIPHFLRYYLLMNSIHAVQGIADDAEIFEHATAKMGSRAREKRDYYLMELDKDPPSASFSGGPDFLEIRKPGPPDTGAVFQLQAAYETEEVLPDGAKLNAPGCRLSAEHIIRRDHSLVAVLDKKIVGKINVSAASCNYRQIGGVYVLPEYRGRGIARILGASFSRSVISEGKKIVLFVKKNNAAAQKVYSSLGFTAIADYRISYY